MLVDRLIIEGQDGVETLDLHPRLTVVGGIAPDTRNAFYNMFAGVLHGHVRGVHAEVRDNTGRRLVVLRPGVGQGRVVDVETSADVSMQFRGFDGQIDLLTSTSRQASVIRITAADLTQSTLHNDAVRSLAALDQVALWDIAEASMRDGLQSEAHMEWQDLVGDIDVQWAMERRAEIQAASRLRQHITALRSLSSSVPDLSDDDTVALAHGMVARIGDAGHEQGARPPVVLDEPFVSLEPAVVPLLLELLPGLFGELQVILLTDDDAIASWARLEALAGELALVEPALANG